MSAYVVVHGTVTDREKYKEYGGPATEIIRKYGGEFLVAGPPQVLAGEHGYRMMSIVRFPDADSAERFYQSEEYQKLIPIRQQAVDCTILVCGG